MGTGAEYLFLRLSAVAVSVKSGSQSADEFSTATFLTWQMSVGIARNARTPLDAAAPEPEMRLAVLPAPNRRMEGGGSVFMPRDVPVGTLVRQKIHLEHPSTSAGAKHRDLLEITVLFDHVEAPATKALREVAGNEDGPVWRNKP
jgi:hypothetical protein